MPLTGQQVVCAFLFNAIGLEIPLEEAGGDEGRSHHAPGRGLYTIASKAAHSCQPNCIW